MLPSALNPQIWALPLQRTRMQLWHNTAALQEFIHLHCCITLSRLLRKTTPKSHRNAKHSLNDKIMARMKWHISARSEHSISTQPWAPWECKICWFSCLRMDGSCSCLPSQDVQQNKKNVALYFSRVQRNSSSHKSTEQPRASSLSSEAHLRDTANPLLI